MNLSLVLSSARREARLHALVALSKLLGELCTTAAAEAEQGIKCQRKLGLREFGGT